MNSLVGFMLKLAGKNKKIKNSNKILNIIKIRIQYQNAFFFREYVLCLCIVWSKKLKFSEKVRCFDGFKKDASVIMYNLHMDSKKSAIKPKQCELLKSLLKLYNNNS